MVQLRPCSWCVCGSGTPPAVLLPALLLPACWLMIAAAAPGWVLWRRTGWSLMLGLRFLQLRQRGCKDATAANAGGRQRQARRIA